MVLILVCIMSLFPHRWGSSHLVGNFCIFIQEHLQLADADAEVSVCELIGDIEPQRPKLSPLQHVPMEEAK